MCLICAIACGVDGTFAQTLESLGRESSDASSNRGEPIEWGEPFESINWSSENELILLVITNDLPWPSRATGRQRVDELRQESTYWCKKEIDHAVRSLNTDHPRLASKLRFQSISAGLPMELTGGKSDESPSRAVVAVCDNQYRLLSFVVGVPDANELASMIEDAEETSVLIQHTKDDPQTVIDRLADRSRSRINRRFRSVLADIVSAARSGGNDDDYADPQVLRNSIRMVALDIDPIYSLDAKLRFAIHDPSDLIRLQVLEQHVETRRPWCETMLPFVVGVSFIDTWQPLVESIWGHPPITEQSVDTDLHLWVRSRSDSNSIVLMIESPMKLKHLNWPPVNDPTDRRSVAWNDAHTQALKNSFRVVSVGNLANLIREFELKPINLYQPTFVRYLILQPKTLTPIVIRPSDPPNRFRRMLKRSKSTPVQK